MLMDKSKYGYSRRLLDLGTRLVIAMIYLNLYGGNLLL